jgi:hypothetical protein
MIHVHVTMISWMIYRYNGMKVNFVNKFGSEGIFYLFSGDIVFPTSVPKLNIINPVNKWASATE